MHRTEATTTYGDYCIEDHLFPYRTEKLSSIAQMVLRNRESMSSPFLLKAPTIYLVGAFLCRKNYKEAYLSPLLLNFNWNEPIIQIQSLSFLLKIGNFKTKIVAYVK